MNRSASNTLMKHTAGGNGDANDAPTREKVLNDLMNTGISAALIGGFALGNFQGEAEV